MAHDHAFEVPRVGKASEGFRAPEVPSADTEPKATDAPGVADTLGELAVEGKPGAGGVSGVADAAELTGTSGVPGALGPGPASGAARGAATAEDSAAVARLGADSGPSAAANVPARPAAAPVSVAPSVRDIDAIYRETDRLYYEFARGCGLSTTAFWSLVSAVAEGGSTTQATIANEYSFSRQTVNSAIKSLEARGLVRIEAEGGSRRSKAVALTDAGVAFCEEHVCPAVDAERRAFDSLGLEERREFVRLVRAYADAIDTELGKLRDGASDSSSARGTTGSR